MELLAFLGDDKETWGQVTGLINNEDWDKIILIKSGKGKDFMSPKKSDTIIIDSSKQLTEIKNELMEKLKGKFSQLEACLSIASGNGKEHLAILAALLNLPIGIRLVVFTKKGVEFLT